LQPGYAFKSACFSSAGVRLLRGTNIEPGRTRWEDVVCLSPEDAEQFANYRLCVGDIVIAMDRPIISTGLKLAVLAETDLPSLLLQRVGRFQCGSLVEPKFMLQYLRSPAFIGHIDRQATGTQLPHISGTDIETAPFLLPPIPEQRRIVAKLEALQTRSRRARAALDAVPPLLEKLRQSILAAAFRGDLTKDWRAKNKKVEPAEKLLARIRVERRKKWEEAELAKMTAKGKVPKDDGWKAKYKEPEPVDTAGLPELPVGWCWASVEEVSILVTDGDHNPPKRVSAGIPHLTAKNIKHHAITFDGCSFVTEEGFEQTKQRYEPLANDLIITCVGTLGQTAIVPEGVVFSADRNLAAIRLVRGLTPRFMILWLDSMWVQQHLGIVSGSTAQPHLYLNDLRALAVPIAPASEQEALISAVSAALDRASRTLGTTNGMVEKLGGLDRALLAKAFRGELVPQDPNDEPAQATLAQPKPEGRPKAKARR